MKQIYALILAILLMAGKGTAHSAVQIDSIRQVLKSMPEADRLPYLRDLSNKNIQNESRFEFARMLKDEATRQGNDEFLADAIFLYARHYYSVNPDSMRYWLSEYEPLFLQLKRHEELCRMKGWSVYLLTREGAKEQALMAVEELRRLSTEINFPEGLEMADQSMGDFYFFSDMPDEGEALYIGVLQQMEKRDAPLIKRLNIIRQLFNYLPDRERRLFYLGEAERHLERLKAEEQDMIDEENPVYSLDYTVHRNYAHEYLGDSLLDKAWEHLQKAEAIGQEYSISRAKWELAQCYSYYYVGKGEYTKALDYIDLREVHSRQRNHLMGIYQALYEKAEVLNYLKRHEETMPLYDELLSLKDSINRNDFNAKLADVRTKYEVEKLELEKQQAEVKTQQTKNRSYIWAAGVIILSVIVLLLTYLIRISQHRRRDSNQAKEKAEEADRLKSAFLANMNHEIRTPLNAIVGFSQVLMEEEDPESRKEYVEIIQSNNELLQRLIGDVLDFSKIESNTMSLIYSVQDIPALMKEIYNVTSLRIPEGLELKLEPGEPIAIETDRNRLMQILTNLLTNAIKHTEKGYIRFGYELTDTNIQFYVEDTGEGIAKEQLETIFDRFVQLENGKKGVGLGLAICKGLISIMGGDIWVTSELGVGSTFYVSLPKVKSGKQ